MQLIDREHGVFTLYYVEDGQRKAVIAEHVSDLIPRALELSKGGAAYIVVVNNDGDLSVSNYRDGSFVEYKTVRCATLGLSATV